MSQGIVFRTQNDAKMFVMERSVTTKKPFWEERSDAKRLTVECTVAVCCFRMSFDKQIDDAFHLVEDVPTPVTQFFQQSGARGFASG